MKTIRVPDKYDMVEFTGELLADVSTETPSAVRWTEIEIYRTEAGNYVIHRVGRSVLYHVHQGVCNTGVGVKARDLDDDAQPCRRCRPPEWEDLPDEMLVDQELDKHQVDVCSAHEVQQRLTLRRPDGSTFMSNPAQRAFTIAAEADPALQDHTVRRVM